mmetsp:Transcript_50200/g.102333  ORF Transcript_50200/g.102333 Transcript_50200/m.102333 type:complete len:277 (+) Transcript_50200:90-920(+)
MVLYLSRCSIPGTIAARRKTMLHMSRAHKRERGNMAGLAPTLPPSMQYTLQYHVHLRVERTCILQHEALVVRHGRAANPSAPGPPFLRLDAVDLCNVELVGECAWLRPPPFVQHVPVLGGEDAVLGAPGAALEGDHEFDAVLDLVVCSVAQQLERYLGPALPRDLLLELLQRQPHAVHPVHLQHVVPNDNHPRKVRRHPRRQGVHLERLDGPASWEPLDSLLKTHPHASRVRQRVVPVELGLEPLAFVDKLRELLTHVSLVALVLVRHLQLHICHL